MVYWKHFRMGFDKSILVLPHVNKIGGAGIYNQDVIRSLVENYHVCIGGEYRHDYEGGLAVGGFELFSKLCIFPMYSGVSYKAKLYFLLRIILSLPIILFCAFQLRNTIKRYDIVILTSSIQTPLIFFLKLVQPELKVVIFIQENFIFSDSLISLCGKKNLLKASLVISITKEWKACALKNGINSCLLVNDFISLSNDYVVNKKQYDLLYVGGDSRLKGFFEVLEFVKEASKEKSFSIAMLGKYSSDSQVLINSVNQEIKKSGVKIVYIGFVDYIYPYLIMSKVLLLPIQSPHFCGPAIEAGICKVPFLIPDFEGELDFAIDEFNCFRYPFQDVSSLVVSFKKMISDDRYLYYGKNNYSFYLDNYEKNNFSSSLIRFIRDIS